MKIIAVLILLCPFVTVAKAKDILSCKTKIAMPDSPTTEMDIRIFLNNKGDFAATYSTKQNGVTVKSEVVNVDAMKGSVREGLTGEDLESDDGSEVERFIVHALAITQDKELKDYFSAGFDLTKVRDATVYLIAPRPEDNIGKAAVIQARDADGKVLGSFLGGLFVTPCQP